MKNKYRKRLLFAIPLFILIGTLFFLFIIAVEYSISLSIVNKDAENKKVKNHENQFYRSLN